MAKAANLAIVEAGNERLAVIKMAPLEASFALGPIFLYHGGILARSRVSASVAAYRIGRALKYVGALRYRRRRALRRRKSILFNFGYQNK